MSIENHETYAEITAELRALSKSEICSRILGTSCAR